MIGYKLFGERQVVLNPKRKAARSLNLQTVEAVVVLAEDYPASEAQD